MLFGSTKRVSRLPDRQELQLCWARGRISWIRSTGEHSIHKINKLRLWPIFFENSLAGKTLSVIFKWACVCAWCQWIRAWDNRAQGEACLGHSAGWSTQAATHTHTHTVSTLIHTHTSSAWIYSGAKQSDARPVSTSSQRPKLMTSSTGHCYITVTCNNKAILPINDIDQITPTAGMTQSSIDWFISITSLDCYQAARSSSSGAGVSLV